MSLPLLAAGSGAAGVLYTTFDPATLSDATLSNGNLTVTHTVGTANTGVKGKIAASSGQYYFELTHVSGGAGDAVGLVTSAGTYGNVLAGTNCTVAFTTSGNISSNNGASGKNIGTLTTAGTVIGVAVDLTARKAWLRKGAGNWNGLAIGSENPATGLGGVTVAPTVAFLPVVGFGASAGGDSYTANFGQAAFANAAPAGFGIWPGV
jgi:hypothetical protein